MRIPNINYVFCLLATIFSFDAQSAVENLTNAPAGEIVRAGICVQRHVTSRYSQPQSTAGYATNGPLEIVRETNTIPLQKNIGFGFAWKAKNLPPQAELVYLIEHPSIAKPDGTTLDHFEEPLFMQSNGGKIESVDCYQLSEDHELVPGQWSLSVHFQGRQLFRQVFNVQR